MAIITNPDWVPQEEADYDEGKPIRSELGLALAGNPIAIALGKPGAQRITDASMDTGASTSAGRTWVGLRNAGLAVGAVGTYAILRFNTLTAALEGATHAGSALRYCNAAGTILTGNAPSGTWRAMGETGSASSATSTTVFLRIS